MVLELERAQRMRDALERVRDAVRVVVERIDAPLVAGALVGDVADAVHRGVAHVDVRARQVDLEPEHVRAIGILALLHRAEQLQVLLDRSVAVDAGAAGLGERSAQRTHLVGRRAVDVGEPRLDEVAGEFVEPVEVVRRVIEVRAPVEPQPAHRRHDRVGELDVLLHRIGIVEAKMADAAVFGGEPEVQADRFGMTDMQVAIGLGRKAGDDAPAVFARAQVLGDDVAQKIRGRGCDIVRRCNTHYGLFMNK